MDTSNQSDSQPEALEQATNEAMLSAIEARILGALMEKQLTTPDAYPLTLNSLVVACNQKTSREPVMSLEEGEVQRCLYQLQDRKLVEFDYGARADKFDQRLSRTLHFNDAEHAIFCLMLLRGPQTVNELLSRSRRMYEFENSNEVEVLLTKLQNKLKPLLVQLPQQPGQREARYMHKLCGEPEVAAISSSLSSNSRSSTLVSDSTTDDLVARVEELEKQMAILLEQVKL
mgnify:CR=1 FL=1